MSEDMHMYSRIFQGKELSRIGGFCGENFRHVDCSLVPPTVDRGFE